MCIRDSASFIRWQGRGILFSAPSGTGKSTQANLWVQHQGAEVINGDRAALRQVGGRWQAFGLPYACLLYTSRCV